MMRLPLLAVFALAATAADPAEEPVCSDTKPCPQTGDPAAVTHFCRPAVAASGAACEAEKVTCAKLSARGESCGGTGLECFRNKCAGDLGCRKNPVTLPGDNPLELPGTCAKQCDLGEGEKVFEGWTGPVDATPANWCKTRYCDGSGATDVGDLKDATGNPDTCATDIASGLKCCPEADKAKKAKDTDPEPVQVCCGATGRWIVLTEADGSDKKEKQYCAHVLAAKDSTAAPFSESCKDQCSFDDPATKFDDGWRGPDVREGKWCNTCVCTRTQMQCTERPCPTLQCCAEGAKTAGTEEVCCGVTGEWVPKDANDMATCHGVTRAFAAEVAAPFHTQCDALRDCKFTSNVEVVVKDGTSAADPRPGQGCNMCACADGKLTCETNVCEAPKCCATGDKMAGTAEVCCGLTGAWVAVETEGAKCGSHAAKVDGAAATGYPFFKECDPQCAANTAAGGPDKMVPLGWTAPRAQGGKWCDLCKCAVAAGAPAGTAPVVTCTTLAECPETKCCRSDNNMVPEGFACCGATRKWVKVEENEGKKEALCAGVTVTVDTSVPPVAPLDAMCAAPQDCTLPGGETLGDGLTGRDSGDAGWCNLCRCDAGTASCTTHTCTKKCCDKGTRPTPDHKCCGADGLWVVKGTDDKFMCGGVLVAGTATHLYPSMGTEAEQGICEVAATMCKLHNAAKTEVALGWSGSGLGDKWCHTCKCRAADLGAAVWCPATPTTCPEQAALRCCSEEITTGNVCCGLTGKAVPEAGMCGSVNLKDAAFAADKAPLGAACPKCTVDGHAEAQAAGWSGYVLGDHWCKKCQCIAGGHTRCFAEATGCPELKCCRPNTKPMGDALCCGATGEWVVGDAAECAGHTTAASEAAPKKPFHTGTCADPAGGCTIPGVAMPVHVGWVGKVDCNFCACLAMDVHRCTTKVCPP